jgi:hypothetical protein
MNLEEMDEKRNYGGGVAIKRGDSRNDGESGSRRSSTGIVHEQKLNGKIPVRIIHGSL